MDGVWRTINGVHVLIGKDGSILKGPKVLQKSDIQKRLRKQFRKKEEPKGFEDSKIRDKDGNLLKVYHGTSQDFNEFDEKFIRERKDETKGFYFATEERKDSVAGYYAGEKGTIKEAYLNVKKPLYIKTNETSKLENMVKSGEIKKYDGIVRISSEDLPESKYYNYRTKTTGIEKIKKGDIIEIIVFSKEQIKILK